MARIAADLLLIAHLGVAAFIVAGFVMIPIGGWLRWRWVRQRGLRLAHLGGIVFVALEAIAGFACPLTVWEDWLRGRPIGESGFIERWVGGLLYWDLPPAVFTATYLACGVLALALWRWVPPQPRPRR